MKVEAWILINMRISAANGLGDKAEALFLERKFLWPDLREDVGAD